MLQGKKPRAAWDRYPPGLWVRELQEGRGWGGGGRRSKEVRWALLDREWGPRGLSGFDLRATSSRMQNPDVHLSKTPEQSCQEKGDRKRAASHQFKQPWRSCPSDLGPSFPSTLPDRPASGTSRSLKINMALQSER